MKIPFFIILTLGLLTACENGNKSMDVDRYIIETEVKIKPGKTNDVLALFKATNPDLVKGEQEWIRASFSAVEDMDIVVVRAEWKSKIAYLEFANSVKFKATMGQFGQYFAGKPKVTITKVLFEM